MRIGIDIDETLTDTEKSFNECIKKYNIDFKKGYKETWTKEEEKYLLGNYCEEIIDGAKFKVGAKKVLEILNKEGHELYIITARCNRYSENIENITYKLLEENNIYVKKIYFGQNKKSDIAKKLKLDLMIDDSINVYKNMKIENIDCILFGDKIKSWEEVLEYIERNKHG